MLGNNNIEESTPFQTVTIGRMKGKIFVGDKIYKMSNRELNRIALESLSKENVKIPFDCIVNVKKEKPISITIINSSDDPDNIYSNLSFTLCSDVVPVEAQTTPITAERITLQMQKTSNTPYYFQNIQVNLDDNLFVAPISSLNELRRKAIERIELVATNRFLRESNHNFTIEKKTENIKKSTDNKALSILLNKLNSQIDYTKLEKVDNIYIPLRFFLKTDFSETITLLTQNANVYLYLPTICKNFAIYDYAKFLEQFPKLKGIVLSNISHLQLIEKYATKFEFIANYTFNIFNNTSAALLKKLGVTKITISPELSKECINTFNSNETELIAYGRLAVMNSAYCLLGKSNKCYLKCDQMCKSKSEFSLTDRMGFEFKLDTNSGNTTIYNSKITSISLNEFISSSARLDFLDEDIDEINNVIKIHNQGNRLEGEQYTNGNFNREV